MARPDDKTNMDELDLDIKKTGSTIGKDQASELAEGDLDKVAGGQRPLRTITCDAECNSYACLTMVGCA